MVRLWLEGDAATARRRTWRGQVTRVDSGERLYASCADEVPMVSLSRAAPVPGSIVDRQGASKFNRRRHL